MKVYDIPVRGKQKEYEISVGNRHVIPLVVENLPNKFLLILRNDLSFHAGSMTATDTTYKTLSVQHGMVLRGGDILVDSEKEISIYHGFTFDHEGNVQTERTISLNGETLVFNSSSEFTSTRYRLLEDIDTMTLAELDGYTLEELDYMTVGQEETDG